MNVYVKRDIEIYYQFIESNMAEWNDDVIVCIHGLGLDLTTWSPLLPHLRQNFDLLLIDIRGHGKSSRGNGKLSWELLIEDLHRLLQKFKHFHLHLVGQGLGGHLALQIAATYPELIRSLTLLSTPCIYHETWMEVMLNYQRVLVKESTSLLAEKMIPQICLPLTEEKEKLLYQAYTNIDSSTFLEYLELIAHSNWAAVFRQIQCPTLHLAGECDSLFPPNAIGLGSGFMNQARFLVIPNASNMMQLDQPELLAEWIESFISEKVEQIKKDTFILKDEFINQYHTEVNSLITAVIRSFETTEECKVQILERFRVKINGTEVLKGWNQRNAKSLFTYLLIHESTTREQLCDLFWPDVEISKARSNLRVALAHLKKLIPEKFLVIDNEHIHIKRNIQCDYYHLKEVLQLLREEQGLNKRLVLIDYVVKRFPQPLFPGFYDNWILEIREQIEQELSELCQWAVDVTTDQGNVVKSKQFSDFLYRLENR